MTGVVRILSDVRVRGKSKMVVINRKRIWIDNVYIGTSRTSRVVELMAAIFYLAYH